MVEHLLGRWIRIEVGLGRPIGARTALRMNSPATGLSTDVARAEAMGSPGPRVDPDLTLAGPEQSQEPRGAVAAMPGLDTACANGGWTADTVVGAQSLGLLITANAGGAAGLTDRAKISHADPPRGTVGNDSASTAVTALDHT